MHAGSCSGDYTISSDGIWLLWSIMWLAVIRGRSGMWLIACYRGYHRNAESHTKHGHRFTWNSTPFADWLHNTNSWENESYVIDETPTKHLRGNESSLHCCRAAYWNELPSAVPWPTFWKVRYDALVSGAFSRIEQIRHYHILIFWRCKCIVKSPWPMA